MAKAWQSGGGSSGKPVGGKDWQKGSARKAPTQPGGPPWWQSRRVRIWAVVLSIFAVAGFFVGVIMWPTKLKVPQIVMIEAGYEDNLGVPHFVAGRNSCRAIEQWWDAAVFPGTNPKDKQELPPIKVTLDDPAKVL